ncbi:MAG: hypothetical protein RMK49_09650 [Abditibacteriales bacterium]|nr:hypothetical protein [Abditibacteriales bacterium]
MRLPEALQQRPFAEWNRLVKGIVEVWELARSLGFEQTLEEHLSRDEEGRLAELLGCLGCELLNLNGLEGGPHQSDDPQPPLNRGSLLIANALTAFFFMARVGSQPQGDASPAAPSGGPVNASQMRVLPLCPLGGMKILDVGAFAIHGDQAAGNCRLRRVSARALSRA